MFEQFKFFRFRVLLMALLALGTFGMSNAAMAACGGKDQRACCVGDDFGARGCRAGLTEQGSCKDTYGAASCKCSNKQSSVFSSEGVCRDLNCGKLNQRPCTVVERIPSCDEGLVELSGKCRLPNCGAKGQNACNAIVQAALGRQSCDEGLVELSGKCRLPNCGAKGQNACNAIVQAALRRQSCDAGLIERSGKCQLPNCGGDGKDACNLDIQIALGRLSCDAGNIEVDGKCYKKGACGANGQRPCTLLADNISPSCKSGLIEDFGAKKCVTNANLSCGKVNKRACLIIERLAACDTGLYQKRGLLGDTCVSHANSDLQKAITVFETVVTETASCLDKMPTFVDNFVKANIKYISKPGGLKRDLQRGNLQVIDRKISAKLKESMPAGCTPFYKSVSLSVAADAGMGLSLGDEVGVVINLTNDGPSAKIYRSVAVSGGLITGAGAALNIGLLTGTPLEVDGEGLGFGASFGPEVVAAGVAISFNPEAPTPKRGTLYVFDVDHFAGVVFSVSAGASIVPVDIRATSSLTSMLDTNTLKFASSDQALCGKENNRPCWVIERLPSCDAGLREDFIWHSCISGLNGSIGDFKGAISDGKK